ncbi:LysR family transcriptional regulator [Paracidovorax konjaci]|uniref:LysR family transcriptional regulator, regulator of gene expression of beta-lactamase n=1 Tax=Paracidovorax konjaci TaxID=32040 RepID=A0A1I1SZR9_9BURK|nr:LysR family transcriptional regulator [Paracidovorax konjaci]SFD51944.1 LysR family transcriptional regulator, regulator of gene expression of beta-lactamase [Paracidovorax konjaci]
MHLPLNALRAFEVSARHLNLTRAAEELHVTQTAVSQHIRNLEERLGKPLFRRLPRGLALTDEGLALLPALTDAFGRMEQALAQFSDTRPREVLTVGAVGTFAVGWLLPRLRDFHQQCPFVDLRLLTNNNRVDIAGEGLDCAIRFGDGAWHGTEADRLMDAPLSAMCSPALAARLHTPADLAREPLLRSYRTDEWAAWFLAAGVPCPVVRGTVFDSSLALAEAAAQGAGVALLPTRLFERELRQGRLVRPFGADIALGAYWLTRLRSRAPSSAMAAFRAWLVGACTPGRPAEGSGAGHP